ncbi:MAG TPA: hypothetical protein VIW26_11755 [Gemmatimonadales bacterium]|jgi:hypothetical protein
MRFCVAAVFLFTMAHVAHAICNNAECDDGNLCNGTETCQGDFCVAAQPLDCDDHDDCTSEKCDVFAGCRHIPLSGCTTSTTLPGPSCLAFVTQVDPFDCIKGRIGALDATVTTEVDAKPLKKFLRKMLRRTTRAVGQAARSFYKEGSDQEEDTFERMAGQQLATAIRLLGKFQRKLDSPIGQRLNEERRTVLRDMAEAVRSEILNLGAV